MVYAVKNENRRVLAELGAKSRKGIENAVLFMLNTLAIKLNLMPEFLSLLGRAKIR